MKQRKAVLMCQTPLQALIAEKVIACNPDTQFYPIYTAYTWNNKHEHYATRLLEKCQCGLKKEIATLEQIASLVTEVVSLEFEDIYLASIDAPLNLAVLTQKEVNIYTYDDGSANVTPKSFYFRKYKQPVEYPGLTITWDKEKVRACSRKHYTVFDSTFNIVSSEKLERLDLFKFDDISVPDSNKKSVSVLIGQMVARPGDNERLMQHVMAEHKIDYFFPHPRENRLESLMEQTIQTDLIFEEYYLELLKTYDEIALYHFCSTVALNLKDHPRVKEIIIDKIYYESWYFTV